MRGSAGLARGVCALHQAHEVNRSGVVAHALLAGGLALVLLARRAEAAPPDGNAREREQSSVEFAFGFTGGTVSVGAARFHASGVNGAYVRASGAELGSTQPFVLGAAAHGLYFPTTRFAFGLYADGAVGPGGSTVSPTVAAAMPTYVSTLTVGPGAEVVVLEGRTSLRLGAVFGLRASSITLDAKDYRNANGHPGSASAADLFVSPRVTLMHRWGDLSNVGMYLGLDVVKSDVLAPGFGAGFVVAIR